MQYHFSLHFFSSLHDRDVKFYCASIYVGRRIFLSPSYLTYRSPGFSYIFYILTQLEWSWPSVTKTVLRATSFPWKPSSSTTRPPSTMGTRLSQDAILNNTVQCYREFQAHLKLRTECIGAGRFISLPTEIFGNFCWMSLSLILHINFFEYEKKKIKLM